jgi:hypothetical protein
MTDELITQLAKISALRVISRTSVMGFKRRSKPLAEIARELNVDAVVEGAVVRSAERVRVTTQVIQVNPEKHLWAERYDRPLGDVVALQRDLARQIAQTIRITLTPQEQTRLADVHEMTRKRTKPCSRAATAGARGPKGGRRKRSSIFSSLSSETLIMPSPTPVWQIRTSPSLFPKRCRKSSVPTTPFRKRGLSPTGRWRSMARSEKPTLPWPMSSSNTIATGRAPNKNSNERSS